MHCGFDKDTRADTQTKHNKILKTSPSISTETYYNASPPSNAPKGPRTQITCLLLLLLLKVPDLSTAVLMLLTFCTISFAIFGFSASKSYLFVPPSLCTTSLKVEEHLADCWQATTDLMWYEEVRPFSNIPVARLADGMIYRLEYGGVSVGGLRLCARIGRGTYVEVSPVDCQNPLMSPHEHRQLPGDNVFLGRRLRSKLLAMHQTSIAPCKHPCNLSQSFVLQEFRTSS